MEPVGREQRWVLGEGEGSALVWVGDLPACGPDGGCLLAAKMVARRPNGFAQEYRHVRHGAEVRGGSDDDLHASGTKPFHRLSERGRGRVHRYAASQVVGADDHQDELRCPRQGGIDLPAQVAAACAWDGEHPELDLDTAGSQRFDEPRAEAVAGSGSALAPGDGVAEEAQSEG